MPFIFLLLLGIWWLYEWARPWGGAMKRKIPSIFCLFGLTCRDLPANHADYGHCSFCGHKPKSKQ